MLSFALAGPANANFVSAKEAEAAVDEALSEALAPIDRPVDVAVITGAHLPASAHDALSRRAGSAGVIRTDEFEACLAAGLCATPQKEPGRSGVVVMAGTGSFCKGRGAAGREAYAGGWGPLIGDEGSGYDIARLALTAVAMAADARGEKTALTEMALSHFAIRDAADLKKVLYAPPIRRHELAEFAECVFRAADLGDIVAGEILNEAGMRLARLAEPVLRKLFGSDESFPVALCGGVLTGESAVSRALRAEIAQIRPRAQINLAALQPVMGTIVIGLDSIGAQIDSQAMRNLAAGDARMRARAGSQGRREE